MQELLWLLLPVAAASGWYFANHSRADDGGLRKSLRNGRQRLSPEYFRGLNYLLNEQPDKATDVFVKMLDVDSETVETHLAVGNLFRQRGEVERAIRIHQNLVERSNLRDSERFAAVLELGRDYKRAGLLDRAEQYLNQIVDVPGFGEEALTLLQNIYQQEREWENAIETARRIQKKKKIDLSSTIAHYFCELAEEARLRRDPDRAMDFLRQAAHTQANCVRVSILTGQLYAEMAEYEKAIAVFKRVGDQDPSYLSEVVEAMVECYYRLDRLPEMADYLQRKLLECGHPTLVVLTADLLMQQHGDQAAAIFIAHHVSRYPSLASLAQLVDLSLAKVSGEVRDTLRVMRKALDALLENRPRYRCQQCGFSSKRIYWLCPTCNTWNAMRPVDCTVLHETTSHSSGSRSLKPLQ